MLSPIAVTSLFFVAQLYLSFQAPEAASSLAAASATDAPGNGSVEIRTVVEIRPVAPRTPTEIPENEAEFWSLLSRDGHIIFRSDEVGVLNTPARRFSVEEVDVITVESAP